MKRKNFREFLEKAQLPLMGVAMLFLALLQLQFFASLRLDSFLAKKYFIYSSFVCGIILFIFACFVLLEWKTFVKNFANSHNHHHHDDDCGCSHSHNLSPQNTRLPQISRLLVKVFYLLGLMIFLPASAAVFAKGSFSARAIINMGLFESRKVATPQIVGKIKTINSPSANADNNSGDNSAVNSENLPSLSVAYLEKNYGRDSNGGLQLDAAMLSYLVADGELRRHYINEKITTTLQWLGSDKSILPKDFILAENNKVAFRLVALCCAADGIPVLVMLDFSNIATNGEKFASLKPSAWIKVHGELFTTAIITKEKKQDFIPTIRVQKLTPQSEPKEKFLY